MASSRRIQSIDFWRGVVLLVIFIDHVPGNLFSEATPRNFGFSDAAEAFVFMSGLVLGYINWPRIERGDAGTVVRACLRRAGQLYAVQVVLALGALALFGAAFVASGEPAMLTADNRAAFFDNPTTGLVGTLLLSYQIGYFNILSVYVVLMIMAAGLFWLMSRSIVAAFALSGALFVIARFGIMLPSWPVPYTWFLNPIAWQFLFVIGIAAGALRRSGPLPHSRFLFTAACLYLVFALAVTTGFFGFGDDAAGRIASAMEMNKGVLGWSRLLHFLALAYVVSQLRLGDLLLKVPGSGRVPELGRQSLSIFAAGSILSAVGQIVLRLIPRDENPLAFHLAGVALVAAGVGLMIGLAQYLSWRQASSSEPRVPTPVAKRPASAVLAGFGPRQSSSVSSR